jgi:NADH:ubiquinone oxidoreductase subunit K
MCIELMLNAANLALVHVQAGSTARSTVQIMAFFVMVRGRRREVVVGLGYSCRFPDSTLGKRRRRRTC